MATITTLNSADSGSTSRTVLNTNLANLNTDKIETSVISTDGTLAGNSDTELPTEKAVKTYVDARQTTSTSGVGTGPNGNTTQTITHGLGRTPQIIRLFGGGNGTVDTISQGVYNSSGSRCIVHTAMSSGGAGWASYTNKTIYLGNSGVTDADGVVGNVTSTTFDIVWTAAGNASASVYLWEAQ